MPSLDNLSPDGKFMGLFIGASGTGKKGAVGSFPRPILFLDADGRIRGLQGCTWLDLKGMGDVETFPPKNKPGEYTYQKVNDKLENLQGLVNIASCPYKTLYLGSITGLAFAFLQDANILTHMQGKGMKLGPLSMTGPQDYKFESSGIKQMLSFLRFLKDHPTGIPNIIIGAHLIPKWGKPGMEDGNIENQADQDSTLSYVDKIGEKFKYIDNIVVGEKLSLTDKLAADVPIYFDHIFKFEKEMVLGQDQPQHFVQFRSEIARTSYAKLPNGRVNITGKPFYEGMMRLAGFPVEEQK
jgi:hypothetical protein